MAKKEKAKKKHTSRHLLFEASGELKRKNKHCPKCGPGTYLANHKTRLTCGKCGYMEVVSSDKKEEKKDDKKEKK